MDSRLIQIKDFYKIKKINKVLFTSSNRIIFEEQKVLKEKNDYSSAFFLINDKNKVQQFSLGLDKDYSMKCNSSKSEMAFLSIRGEKKAKPQIFLIRMDGGEAVKLTSAPNGVQHFNWSLDNKKIVYLHRINKEEEEEENKKEAKKEESDEIEEKVNKLIKEEKEKKKVDPRIIKKIVYRKGTNYLDDRYSHIYILDLDTKKIKRITSGDFDYFSPVLVNNVIYAVKHKTQNNLNDSTTFSIVKIDLESKKEVEIKEIYGWSVNLALTEDLKWLVYNCSLEREGISRQNIDLKAINLQTNEEIWITEKIDNHAFNFKLIGSYVYFVSDSWEINELWKYDLETKKIEKVLTDKFMIYDYDVDQENERIVVNVSKKEEISSLIVYDICKKEQETIYNSNEDWLKDKKIAKHEEIRYKGYNDKEVQGWIIKPPNFDESKKYPIILEIHGGPSATWSPFERTMWHEFQSFAAMGYVIFYCNPRGSSGRGLEYRNVKGNWGEEPSTDILNGFNLVLEKSYVDKDNAFITGGSYGGYMTTWIIGHDERFKAAVPQRGVYNLVSFWSTTDITQFTKEQMGYYPWENLDLLWKQSPIAYVDRIKTPTRIIHSEKDFRVPISQGEELFASLVKLGVETDLIRYPKEGHELSRSGLPKHIEDRLNRIIVWFEEHKNKK
ncbi:MAG: S9 family peptidase [Candidatus Heimdallarchaeaceae archaeon]